MFSRPAFRAARAARVAAPAFRAVRPITVSARLNEPAPEVVAATEVKHSSYADGSVERSTIVVDQSAIEKAGPLSKATFKSLPPTMQKMSLMDKVVVVTGYVLLKRLFSNLQN